MANCNKSHKSFWEYAKKLLSVSLCLAVLFLGLPPRQSARVEAAEEKLSLPDTAFITKDKLLKLCEETNVVDGKPTGLLATGKLKEDGGTDVKLRINFGRRPADTKYYKKHYNDPDTAVAGPTTWLVAGREKFSPEDGAETDSLVLYSEAPLIGCDKLNGTTKTSVFQTDHEFTSYNAPADTGYGATSSTQTVFANHWGASNLRAQLTTLASDSRYFKSTEQSLMATSAISTADMFRSDVEYRTQDFLYATRLKPNEYRDSTNTTVTVGAFDSLTVDKAHWGGCSWLRSPARPRSTPSRYIAPAGLPAYYVICYNVADAYPSISAAFRLNLAPVLFASAASTANVASSGNATFTQVLNDTPMTLRLGSKPSDNVPEYPFTDEHKIDVCGAKLTYSAPAGCRLMVLATGANGNVFQHSIAIDEAVSNKTVDLLEIAGLTSGKDLVAKAWLEADIEDGGSLTYATRPVTVKPSIDAEVTLANGVLQRVRVYDPHDVLPEDVKFSAEYNQTSGLSGFFNDGELGLTWHNYDLTLTCGGEPLSQLAAPVILRLEAVKGIEAADAAVTRINELAKTNLHPSSVTDENGTVWVEVTTDHFSRYILVTGRRAARILLASIATLLILALGFIIKFIRKKKKN